MPKKPSSPEDPSPKHSESRSDTRERLLEAAATLFATQGFSGTSVKEIAEAAGANISLISYHFEGKHGLYRSCLEQFGKKRLAATHRILVPCSSLEEFQIRLGMFFEELFVTHVEDPEMTQLIHRECDLPGNICEEFFRKTFLKSFEGLVEFFATAQKAGILNLTYDAHILAGLSFGAILNTARVDKMNQRYFNHSISDPKYRKLIIQCVISAFTTNFSTANRKSLPPGAP